MKTKFAGALGVVFVTMVIMSIGQNTSTRGQDKSQSDDLAQAKIQYGQALVKVAEADLAKAQEANAQAPDAVPSSAVRSLQNDVAMANVRLKMMQDDGSGNKESPYVAAAKEAISTAEQNVKQAMELNSRVSGTITKAELARRQADVDLAKARLLVAQQLDKATPQQRMQWEILVLQEEVHNLRFAVELLQHHN